HESIPQQPKTADMGKCEHHKRALEYIFALFKVNKSQITLDFEEKLDKVETYIHSIEKTKNGPSHSKITQVGETSEKKPTSQAMDLQSSHLTEQNFQQNNMLLQDHPVESQFISSHSQANQVSIEQGYENVVQQQTNGEITSAVISTSEILASPMLGNCNKVKANCQDHVVVSNDSSPAMQHLIKVMTSVSTEALVASCGDIGMVVKLNDDKSTLEPLNGPPIGAIGTNLEGVIVTDSQARYLTRDFVPRERKMNRFINSIPTSDSLLQLTSAEKPFSNSFTTQENCTLSEEIKEINKRLVDTEIVVDKEKISPSVVKGDIQHGEGLIVKLLFNSVSFNLNQNSNHASNKKSIIRPLWLHIPTSYPHCSVVILDETSSEARKDLNDLSMKVNLKLRLSLQMLSQPLSLKDIAILWDRCAREVICEYAQLHGGGTFTSKYGGWEMCLDAS
ncbi:Mediator of RNA polymerase II transcription subunit 15a, partial [Mucuna pruriens]